MSTDRRKTFSEGTYYQFTHPVYLDGVKRSLEDPEVRRLMASVVLALGEEHKCDNCQYNGPFIHSYKYVCNELNPQGPVCPKCHTWKRLGFVLVGISLPYSLEPVYQLLDMVRYFKIKISDQQIRITLLRNFLQEYTVRRLLEMTVECINEISESKELIIDVDDLYFDSGGTTLSEETPLIEIPNNIIILKHKRTSSNKIKKIGVAIHNGSTDIAW